MAGSLCLPRVRACSRHDRYQDGIADHLSALRRDRAGAHAYRLLPDYLRLHRMRRAASAQAGRLLRFLLLGICSVSTGSTARPLRAASLTAGQCEAAPRGRNRTGPSLTPITTRTRRLHRCWRPPSHQSKDGRNGEQDNRHEEHDLGGLNRHARNPTKA